MHLIYIDDSKDEQLCTFSAICIPAESWRAAFKVLREYRKQLKKSDGIFITTEFHAWKFVSGRGRISDRIVPKGRRCQIYKDTLQLLTTLPGVRLMNAVCHLSKEERAFERLVNRINKNMEVCNSHAVLICDEGKETIYTRLVRRLGVFNPIPSRLGRWDDSGSRTRNMPTERIIEDPFFKRSERSYFIQIADFCAYALLRRERPVASKTKYGLDQAFTLLAPILIRAANSRDPEGIIRP